MYSWSWSLEWPKPASNTGIKLEFLPQILSSIDTDYGVLPNVLDQFWQPISLLGLAAWNPFSWKHDPSKDMGKLANNM